MNKPLLITLGVFFVILIIGIWVYLMMYGTPESTDDVLADVGVLPGNSDGEVRIVDQDATPTIDVLGAGLQQLTTKAVAGATFLDNTIRFVEQGTGHVYDIDLTSGRESQVTRTTVPQVATAGFSPGGQRVALTSYQNYQTNVVVGEIEPNSTLNTIPLQPNARNVEFTSDTTVAYTVPESSDTVGYKQNLSSQVRTEVFRLAFANLLVSWGNESTRPLVYTKPSTELVSYAYFINEDGTLEAATSPAVGTNPVYVDDYLVVTRTISNDVLESVLVAEDETTYPLALLREKCTSVAVNGRVWCGVPFADVSSSELIDWYKGTTQLNDSLWEIRLDFGSASPITNPETDINRSLDIVSPIVNAAGTIVSFINKTDRSLWLYRLDS